MYIYIYICVCVCVTPVYLYARDVGMSFLDSGYYLNNAGEK